MDSQPAKEPSEAIRVTARFRPVNAREKATCATFCMEIPSTTQVTMINNPEFTFQFDRVFPPDSSQKEVYEYAAKPIVDAVLKGFNGTIFAYGQTGAGKTHTMQGPNIEDSEMQGIVPRMVFQIFSSIYGADESMEYMVKVSISEIYQERLRDLLDTTKDNLKIRQDKDGSVFIPDLTELYVQSEDEVFAAMKEGNANRTISYTAMNSESSRSHLIFALSIQQKNLQDNSQKVGKLYLVDLAGSEKVSKSEVSGKQLEEAKQINLSLSVLGRVIFALTENKSSPPPYRESKLTRVLQESFGGNSKTALVIACSPSLMNESETLGTLRFGSRAKMITNKATVNQKRSPEELLTMLEASNRKMNNMKLFLTQLQSKLKENNISVPTFSRRATVGSLDVPAADEDVQEDAVTDMKKELAVKAEEVTELRREYAAARKTVSEMELQRDAIRCDREELAMEIETLKFDKTIEKEKAFEMQKLTVSIPLRCTTRISGSSSQLEKLNDESTLHMVVEDIQRLDSQPENDARKLLLSHLKEHLTSKISLKEEVESLRKQNGDVRQRLSLINTNVKFQDGSSNILDHLDQTQKKVANLETKLAEETEKTDILREKANAGDRPLKHKVSQLDKNLEQLTIMYHKLVSQNSGLKVECQANEKRIARKEQRVLQLEGNLREAKIKYEKLMERCTNLTTLRDVMGCPGSFGPSGPGELIARRRQSNIVRPIRGGQQPVPFSTSQAVRDVRPEAVAQSKQTD